MRTPLTLAFAALGLFTVGCSGSDNQTPDMGAADLSMTTDGGGGGGDMATGGGNTGSLVTSVKKVQLMRVTGDDVVAFFDGTGGVEAVPISGGVGAPTLVAASAAGLVSGDMVLGWGNYNSSTQVGDLSVYTKAAGKVDIDVNTVAFGIAADDGSALVYTKNASIDGASADIAIAKSDGTGKKTLFPGSMMVAPCLPGLRFAGGNFFVAHCDAPTGGTDGGTGDGGVQAPPTATLSMVAPDGTATTIATGLTTAIAVSKDGSHLFALAPNGDGYLYPPTANATGVKVDSNIADGFFSDDGATLFYQTTDGKLVRTATTNPSPTVLVGANVKGVFEVAPDGKTLLFYTMRDDTANTNDLFITSATAPGTPTMIVGPTGAVFGDAYTTDSSRVLFYDNVAAFVGDFKSIPVAGGTATTHGTKVWTSYRGAKPTQAVFNDNYKTVKNTNGRADLEVVDTAGGSPTLICPQAEADFYLNSDRTKVVYAYLATVGKEGIYVANLP